jgi:excisionase family DNA binding protein
LKNQSATSALEPRLQARLLNIRDAAAYLAATVWFMRELVWSRRIPFLKVGNKYAFDRADLDAFVNAQKTAARA